MTSNGPWPLQRQPHLIMVTAYAREEAIELAQQRGAQVHTALNKLTTPSSLLRAIGEELGIGSMLEPPHPHGSRPEDTTTR